MNVDTGQLAKIIETVRENINKQPDYDRFNEARTREALVAPVLRAMGWDVADFAMVDVEYPVNRGKGARMVDYALWPCTRPRQAQEDKPFTLLEAKGVNRRIEEGNDVISIRDYAFEAGVPNVILTNGKIWQHHVFRSPVLTDHYEAFRVDIYYQNRSPCDCAKTLTALFEKVLEDSTHYNLSSGWVSMKTYLDITDKKKRPSINAIRFPDGDEREVNHIRDHMEVVAHWLVDSGSLTTSRCPIFAVKNRQKQLVSIDRPPAEEMPKWKKIGTPGLFVQTGVKGNADDVQPLLEGCGQSPADLYLRMAQ